MNRKKAKKPTTKLPKFTEHKKYLSKVQPFLVEYAPLVKHTRVETLMFFSQLEKTVKITPPAKSFVIDTKRIGSARIFLNANFPEMKFKCSIIKDNKTKTVYHGFIKIVVCL